MPTMRKSRLPIDATNKQAWFVTEDNITTTGSISRIMSAGTFVATFTLFDVRVTSWYCLFD